MNERIKELAEQAGFRRRKYYNSDEYMDNPTIPIESWCVDSELEKFAELIVKECMEMATELEAQYFNNRMEQTDFKMKKIYTEGEAACDILRFKMKQHFGVEE